jgi:hypothetical protein
MYVHEPPARVTVRLLVLKALSPSLFSSMTVVWEGNETKRNTMCCILGFLWCVVHGTRDVGCGWREDVVREGCFVAKKPAFGLFSCFLVVVAVVSSNLHE